MSSTQAAAQSHSNSLPVWRSGFAWKIQTDASLQARDIQSITNKEEFIRRNSVAQKETTVTSLIQEERLRRIPSYDEAANDRALPQNQVIAEWHGQVTSIHESFFVAQLKGVIGDGVKGEIEEATIPCEEIRDEDIELFQLGAFFRLCVGSEQRNGTRRRYTDVIFRRMPAYRKEDLDKAKEFAAQLANDLRLE